MNGALIKACNSALLIKNSGSECNDSMGPSAMLIAIPPGSSWTLEDEVDFYTYANTQIHAALGSRWYPLFGPGIPIRKITLSKESDVVPVQDDGTPIFVRYGMITRVFGTTEGGLCYAQVLQSLNKAGYSFIEVDKSYQVLRRTNEDGSCGGLKTTFMYSPSPDIADLKTPGYTYFQLTFDPVEYVSNGEIMEGDASLLDLVGLLDAEITAGAVATTTTLSIGVSTICAGTDLVAELGTPLATIANFIVTLKSTGVVQTISAAAIVGGNIQLTGTFTAAAVYTVSGAAASVLFSNDIEGIDINQSLDITIP